MATTNNTNSARLLPDGTPLENRLLAALPVDLYARVANDLRMTKTEVGRPLVEHGQPIADVFFPNAGVFSVTNQMNDGELVEVATVGLEGMLGACVFLGDMMGSGTSLQQVPNGSLPTLGTRQFVDYTAAGPFRDIIARYTQGLVLQAMQSTACNALHNIEQRCCRWLLQTHDRIRQDEFQLKHEYLAIMLGAHRPTVTLVLGTLQKAGLIETRYGRIRVLDRAGLEASSCECYAAIRDQFIRLRL